MFLELLWKSYFIPIPYELDRLPVSTNRTNFIFVHNKLGLYATLFMLINGVYIYSGNLPLTVLSVSFSSDIVSVEFLDSCVFLRFTSWIILQRIYGYYLSTPITAHIKVLVCNYINHIQYEGSQFVDFNLVSEND